MKHPLEHLYDAEVTTPAMLKKEIDDLRAAGIEYGDCHETITKEISMALTFILANRQYPDTKWQQTKIEIEEGGLVNRLELMNQDDEWKNVNMTLHERTVLTIALLHLTGVPHTVVEEMEEESDPVEPMD